MELCTNKPYLPILALSLVLSSAFGDISIEGIPSEDYALLSYDPEASCEQHAPVLCGKDKQPSTLVDDTAFMNTKCSEGLQCPPQSHYNSSCFPKNFIPSDITYQFLHKTEGDSSFRYRFSWEEFPENCHVQYYLAMLRETAPTLDECTSFSGVYQCKYHNYTNTHLDAYVKFINFKKETQVDPTKTKALTRFFKLIAYPIYEWPTVKFQIPANCGEGKKAYNAEGCATCTKCTVNKTQPQNFDVQYFNDGKSANVSWSLSESATKYYLHVNSTNKKYLFWFGEDVSRATVKDMDVDDSYDFWLEQFNCGCSNPTPIFGKNLSTYTSTSKSDTPPTSHSSESIIKNTNYVSVSSETLFPTHSSSELAHITVDTSIDILSSSSPSPHNNKDLKEMRGKAYYATLVVVPIAILIFVAIIVITVVVLKRSGSKYFRGNHEVTSHPDKGESSMSRPWSGTTGTINTELPIRVMLIYSTETKEKKELEILTFLDHDLGSFQEEDGSKLFKIYKYDTSMERDHPSEWLDKHYRQCNYIICVVGKKFRREWNDEVRPSMPLIYAFHQLFNSLFNDSSEENHLRKIILVLRNEAKDEKNIPSQYLQGARRFKICDVDGIARYMSGRTKYSFKDVSGIETSSAL